MLGMANEAPFGLMVSCPPLDFLEADNRDVSFLFPPVVLELKSEMTPCKVSIICDDTSLTEATILLVSSAESFLTRDAKESWGLATERSCDWMALVSTGSCFDGI